MIFLLVRGVGMGGGGAAAGTPVGRRNSTDDSGAIVVEILASNSGLVEWRDYIPVFEVTDIVGKQWRTDDSGFIPVVAE